uniref:Putative ovule protein n=1 Tax=Solanum chacoense TaxID=4108 RepID=A0A0V0IGJ1_SOLCH
MDFSRPKSQSISLQFIPFDANQHKLVASFPLVIIFGVVLCTIPPLLFILPLAFHPSLSSMFYSFPPSVTTFSYPPTDTCHSS